MFPGWASIDGARWYEDLLHIAGLIFLGTGVITEFISLFLSGERSKRRFEFWGVVFFLIPLVATEPLAYAYERRVQTLTDQRDKSSQREIAHLNEQLRNTQSMFSSVKQQLGAVNRAQSEESLNSKINRQKLEATENRTLDLERQRQPRTLTKRQRNQMVSELSLYSGRAGVAIRVLSSETEVQDYANQLESALRDSGWGVVSNFAVLEKGKPIYGLKVDVGDIQNPPVGANALVKALRDAGIPVATGLDTDDGPKVLYLFVGSKLMTRREQ
ncbi:MAG: hypothetical protein ACYDDI_13675 [Candidatus Acidiferrales bacterium]